MNTKENNRKHLAEIIPAEVLIKKAGVCRLDKEFKETIKAVTKIYEKLQK